MTSPSDAREVPDWRFAATGIEGLDDVLCGGFTRGRMHLLEGVPGAGKTTIALQFLLEGVRGGEGGLFVTMSETTEEVRSIASSHGWDLDGIAIRELVPGEENLRPEDQYTMFHPSEVELGQTTRWILDDVEAAKPSRVVIDSLPELRILAGTPWRFRRQVLALKKFFATRDCTALVIDHPGRSGEENHVKSVVDALVRLDLAYPAYGSERRRLLVAKYRGVPFRGGYHDYVIRHGGVVVFPRLVASEHRVEMPIERLASGVPELDALLGGGIELGTSTLLLGEAGTGKSSLATQFVASGAATGRRAAMFVFDEGPRTLLARADNLGIDLRAHVDSGAVSIRPIDPAELSPGELVHAIRRAVERERATLIVIDSLNGYLNAMPEERFLVTQLHELLSYLAQAGVATFLVAAQQGLLGANPTAPVEASYLADAVIVVRRYELDGELRRAISVVKKRSGGHEHGIRDFRLEDGRGIVLGPPGPGIRDLTAPPGAGAAP